MRNISLMAVGWLNTLCSKKSTLVAKNLKKKDDSPYI
jgi:hypothetical protein